MLGILWLAVSASVGAAINYRDYQFEPKEAGTNGLVWNSNSSQKHNFTESLNSFHKLFYATRERPDKMVATRSAIMNVQREGVCIQGETKKVECNFCTCYSGHWICTRLPCHDNSSLECNFRIEDTYASDGTIRMRRHSA